MKPLPKLSGIRFDRNEWAGAFGDIGTDLPLLIMLIIACDLSAASVLTIFGVMQIVAALAYRIPMPVQPLKAVAALAIASAGTAGKIPASVIYGAGFGIGAVMLLLTLTGLIERLGRIIPKAVIRGIQLGLGIKLGLIALTKYVYIPDDGTWGILLAVTAFIVATILFGNRKYPASLIIIGLGLIYAFSTSVDLSTFQSSFGFSLPAVHAVQFSDIYEGLLWAGFAQIPLSLGNSIYATRQLADDYFPQAKVTERKIGLSYSLINLVCPFFSGVPVCHGSGGIAGHYAFGGRTGGSVIIYGCMFLMLGLFFSAGFTNVIQVFPFQILGVILLFEGFVLIRLIRDLLPVRHEFVVALLIGAVAQIPRYGFLFGLVGGIVVLRGIELARSRTARPDCAAKKALSSTSQDNASPHHEKV